MKKQKKNKKRKEMKVDPQKPFEPLIMFRVRYKKKKITLPICQLPEIPLKQLIQPYLIRFEKEVLSNFVLLENSNYELSRIQNWKTVNKDIIKDYYFQLHKSLEMRRRFYFSSGFSKVYLARNNNNGKFYAIKLMDKYQIYQFNKKIIVENERMIMVDLDHPFIVKLYAAFETKYFIAFVLECINFFIRLSWWIAFLQSQILQEDELIVCSFLFHCGSPQYMAPQMLKNQGHSYQADYYCLGALLYQLILGVPPFYSKDTNKIKEAILTQEITFPDHINMSKELQMLLEGLLAKNPNHRLGSMKGIRQIITHPWLRKLKWSEVLQKKIQPPFKPDLLTFNFDQNQIGEDEAQFTSLLLNHQSQTINSSEELFRGLYFNSNNESIEIQQELPLETIKIQKEKKTSNNLKGKKSRQRKRTQMQRLNNLKKQGIEISLSKKKNQLTRVKSAQHIKKIR